MKSFLLKLISRKKTEMKNLQERSDASQDLAEVRAIGETLATLKREIEEAEAQLAELEADENGQDETASRDVAVPAGAELRNGQVMAVYGMGGATSQRAAEVDPHDTVEYRQAFMEYVCRNVPMAAELRADAVTSTGDVGAVIPTTILKEIIQELKSFGNVYALVRKLNVQGGVAIPILSLKPEATWIGETAASESKKLEAKNSITFSYFGVECKIVDPDTGKELGKACGLQIGCAAAALLR